MKPSTAVKVFSWTFMIVGLLGLLAATFTSPYDEPNFSVPLVLIGFAMGGFGFLAYLDRTAK
jgi:hypothetical protein